MIIGTEDRSYRAFIGSSRVISLSRLGKYIQFITLHSSTCHVEVEFLGESSRSGLASVLVCRCTGCPRIFRFTTSRTVKVGKSILRSTLEQC